MLNKPRKVSNFLKENIVFFCKDCNEIVEVKPLGRKFVYRCSKCGTKNVAFGTEKSIKGFYRMGDDDEEVKEAPKGGPAKKEPVKNEQEKSPVEEKKPEEKVA